jgi:integrase
VDATARGTATRTIGLLGAIFSFGVRRGLRGENPVRGVERHADGRRDRRLSEAEYAVLGQALRAMPNTAWPIALAATRFLALTGWRRGEMLALKWSEVELVSRTARLSNTKTGYSLRPLSHTACEALRALPRSGELVFPSSVGIDKVMRGFHKVWLRIADRAALGADVSLIERSFSHFCRSFAFCASNVSRPMKFGSFFSSRSAIIRSLAR